MGVRMRVEILLVALCEVEGDCRDLYYVLEHDWYHYQVILGVCNLLEIIYLPTFSESKV